MSSRASTRGDAIEIEWPHGGIGDDGHFPLRKERSHEIDTIQKPGTRHEWDRSAPRALRGEFACFVESGKHLREQGADALAAGLDHQVRDLPVERIALGVKRLEPLARVAALQQRSGFCRRGCVATSACGSA